MSSKPTIKTMYTIINWTGPSLKITFIFVWLYLWDLNLTLSLIAIFAAPFQSNFDTFVGKDDSHAVASLEGVPWVPWNPQIFERYILEPTEFQDNLIDLELTLMFLGARGNERRKNDFGIEKFEDPAEQ